MTNRIERHPITGEIVLITPNRLERPNALLDHGDAAVCPFCPGNEDQTPPEVDRSGTGSDWLVRVVPNKYPAASDGEGIAGRHEVIIESPRHDDELRHMEPGHIRTIIDMWLTRYSLAIPTPGVKYVALFRNRGPHAGESIRHPHSQLLAVPYIPARIASHSASKIECTLCRLLSGNDELLVRRGESFELMAAPAGRFPHQTWIVPARHASDPGALDEQARDELARFLHDLETVLVGELGEISINWYFITPPLGTKQFHWYIEVSPRVTGIAGYELATGSFLNLVPPERSAERLRARIHELRRTRTV